jgi:hypothetical protein
MDIDFVQSENAVFIQKLGMYHCACDYLHNAAADFLFEPGRPAKRQTPQQIFPLLRLTGLK